MFISYCILPKLLLRIVYLLGKEETLYRTFCLVSFPFPVIKITLFGFSKIDRIPKNCNKDKLIEENIKSLAELSLGVYVYLAMGSGNYFYDYTEISKKYPSYIKDNYLSIRSAIPYGAEYYDSVILDGKYSYFSDYVKMLNDESKRERGNSTILVKSTPTGRALTEREESAFVSAIFYPIVIICVLVCIIMVYLLYKYL